MASEILSYSTYSSSSRESLEEEVSLRDLVILVVLLEHAMRSQPGIKVEHLLHVEDILAKSNLMSAAAILCIKLTCWQNSTPFVCQAVL
jgi:hypothetical protein